MKKKLLKLVIIVILLSVIEPEFVYQEADAAGNVVTKSYTAIKDTMELIGHIQYDGIHDNDGNGFLSIGRSNDEFGNVRQRAGVTFDLGVPEGNIVSAELVLTVATVMRHPNYTLYMEARGSAANDLTDSSFPSVDMDSSYADRFTAQSIAEAPMGTYLQNQSITLNVKSVVDAFTDSSDRRITFTLNGNEADAASGWFSIHSLETSGNAAYRPKLIVTYETGPVNNPPVGSFTIAEGAATSAGTVNLSVTGSDPDAGDSVTHMRFASSAANLSVASWLPFSNAATFSLTGGDGSKTIYMQLRDSNSGISANSSQPILLDQTAPIGTLIINDGATWTKTDMVTLKGTYTDGSGSGVDEVRLSNINGSWLTNWFSIADLNGKSWDLPAGEGTKTVYVQYKDKVGNTSNATISSTIIVDTIAPVISNVENGKVYNSKVNALFNEGTATLNGAAFTSGAEIVQDGTYTLVVTDVAGNSATVSFKIDTTAPIVTGVTNGGIYKANVTVAFNKGTATLNGAAFTSGVQITVNGVYTLVVTDTAGNVTTVSFEIDKVAPTVTGVTNNGNYKETVTVTFNEGTATLNGTPFASGTKINLDGSYTLVVTDGAGNVTTVNFKIDTKAPTVNGVTDGGIYKEKITITFNEGTATLNDVTFTGGTDIVQDGVYTLVVTDAAGNVTAISFEIDKTAPIVTGVTSDGIYKEKVTVSFSEGTATLNNATFTSGTEIDQDGTYTLVVTDAAGNVTTLSFKIDTEAPIVTGITEGVNYKEKVTVSFNEGTATLNGAAYTSGTLIDQDGAYTLVVTDVAGNVTTANFKIDTEAPIVTGITEGVNYKEKVTVSFNEGTATLNGAAFPSGKVIDQDGTYTLVVTDEAGNVATIKFFIDTIAPTGTVIIHADAEWTNVKDTILTLTGDDGIEGSGVVEMRFSSNGTDWGDWEPNAATKSWNLGAGDGEKTVFVQFKDKAGNVSGKVINDIIKLDQTIPTGTIVINGGSATTNSKSVTLSLTSSDGAGSGVAEMRFSIDDLTWSDWEKGSLTKNWSLDGNFGLKKLYVQFRDVAGNSSVANMSSIEYKTGNGGGGGGYIPPVSPPIEPEVPTKPETPEQPEQPKPVKFTDLTGHWAAPFIEKLAAKGIISGYTDGSFHPQETISREHIAVLLARALKPEAVRGVVDFTDVSATHPYANEIRQLQQAGIFDGNKNGKFNPKEPITRAQMAKVLVLAFELKGNGKSNFKDVPPTHWSKNYIDALYENGVTMGDKGLFKPNDLVTRAHLAVFLYRALELQQK